MQGSDTPTIYVGILTCVSPRKIYFSVANCMQHLHVPRCCARQSDGTEYKKTLRRPGGFAPDPAGSLQRSRKPPTWWGRAGCPLLKNPPPRSRPFGLRLSYPHSKISSDALVSTPLWPDGDPGTDADPVILIGRGGSGSVRAPGPRWGLRLQTFRGSACSPHIFRPGDAPGDRSFVVGCVLQMWLLIRRLSVWSASEVRTASSRSSSRSSVAGRRRRRQRQRGGVGGAQPETTLTARRPPTTSRLRRRDDIDIGPPTDRPPPGPITVSIQVSFFVNFFR